MANKITYMNSVQKTLNRHRRQGLTLVELLVVVVILSLVTAATIPLMQPATAERRIREASRMVATVLANAQARALTTGRPVGVWFQRLSNQSTDTRAHHAIEMFLCEVPSPFSGESAMAGAKIEPVNPPNPNQVKVTLWEGPPTGMPSLPPKTVQNGDRIRFNYRGHYYTVDANTSLDSEGYITGDSFKITKLQTQQWPQIVGTVPYQIYRQPRKSADAPAQMPTGTVVDLEYSGYASGWLGALENPQPPVPTRLSFHQPVIVMFGSSGNLESVHWGMKAANTGANDPGTLYRGSAASAPWYLLIGQPRGDAAVTQNKENYQNFDNVWIAINPQSGLVTTSEIGSESEVGTTAADTSREIADSRAFAQKAQNMGGR